MDLGRVARTQAGAFTRAQARAAGLSDRQIDVRLADGRWLGLHRGVMAASTTPDSPRLRLWAALLAAGRGAVASHTSAAVLWNWDVPNLGIQLTVPPERDPVLRGGVQIHRLPLHPADVVAIRHLPVTNRVRTLADCAGLLPADRISALLDRAVQQGWLDAADLRDLVSDRRRKHGNRVMRSLAADLLPGAHSEAERTLHRLLTAAGVVGWKPNFRIEIGGGRFAVVDVAFPAHLLAIEVDGRAHHSAPDRFQTDRVRQNALVGLGWTVLRFTWHDLRRQPTYVVAAIRSQLT